MAPPLPLLAFFLAALSALSLVLPSTALSPWDQCSQNGVLFPDSDVCSCFQCYEGPTCAVPIDTEVCDLEMGEGEPLALAQYWEARHVNEKNTVSSSLWYRPAYGPPNVVMAAADEQPSPIESRAPTNPTATTLMLRLESKLRELHAKVDNAVTAGKHCIFGVGAKQILNAAAYAYAKRSAAADGRLGLYVRKPYWFHYGRLWDFDRGHLYWEDSETADPASVVEFVVSPNNPSGGKRTPTYPTSPHLVHDLVYYWPGLTEVTEAVDRDVMVFSLSKATGHAGTRFGWAWVRDAGLLRDMWEYIENTSHRVPVEVQQRALALISATVDSDGEAYAFIGRLLQWRWRRVRELFAAPALSSRFTIRNDGESVFLWVECALDATLARYGNDCPQMIRQEFRINATPGSGMGATINFVRFNMMIRDEAFDVFLRRMLQSSLLP